MTNGEQEIDRLRRRRGWESGGPLEQISHATDTVVSEAFFAGPAVCCRLPDGVADELSLPSGKDIGFGTSVGPTRSVEARMDGRSGPRSMIDEPTLPPPRLEHLSSALRRNIAVLHERRRQEAASATPQERLAAAITAFTGSMPFVYLHLALYGAWIAINVGLVPGLRAFDPSFVILAMAASVEAIFLSTFVLISQNRSAAEADKRADLDLQISLLTEHELTTLTGLVTAIAERLNLPPNDPKLEEVKKDIAPEAVLDEIEAQQASE